MLDDDDVWWLATKIFLRKFVNFPFNIFNYLTNNINIKS